MTTLKKTHNGTVPVSHIHVNLADALLHDKSPLPLYHRVYVVLRELIIGGHYQVGQILPAEAELMQKFGVSRITVKRALDELAAEKLVSRSRGRGTMVTQRNTSQSVGAPITASIEGLFTNLSQIADKTTVKIQSFEYLPAPAFVAQQLDLPTDTVVQCASRVRYLNKQAFSHSVSYVIEPVGRTFTAKDLKSLALIDLLKRAGIVINRVQQAIGCTLADPDSAQLLNVQIGSPLLRLHRVFFDQNERAINFSQIHYPSDRFEYCMAWSRGSDDKLQIESGTRTSFSL